MDEGSTRSLVSRTSIIGGLIGGLVHAATVVVLWNYFGLDDLGELVAIKPLYGLYLILGMFVLGFLPALFYVGQNYIFPAFVVSGSLFVSAIGSWQAGPVRAPVGGPTPFGVYVVFWVGVVVLAGLAAGFERTRKR